MIYNPEICNVEPVDIDNNIMNTNFSYINDKEDTEKYVISRTHQYTMRQK